MAIEIFLIMLGSSLAGQGLLWVWLGGRWWGVPEALSGFVLLSAGLMVLGIRLRAERGKPKQNA